MSQVDVGPLRVREPDRMMLTGEVVEGHLHNFDHVTFFLSGLWLITCTVNGKDIKEKVEGGILGSRRLIRADVAHRFEVLRGPACYVCVYPHLNKDGTVSTKSTGWEAAYGIPELKGE